MALPQGGTTPMRLRVRQSVMGYVGPVMLDGGGD